MPILMILAALYGVGALIAFVVTLAHRNKLDIYIASYFRSVGDDKPLTRSVWLLRLALASTVAIFWPLAALRLFSGRKR